MLAAVRLHVEDVATAAARLGPALAALGLEPEPPAAWGAFALVPANRGAITCGLHVAFIAPSLADVEAFWHAGMGAGLRDDGPPGPRPQYAPDYHAAFLRDTGGNSFEAVHHADAPRQGVLDHVTVRVADLASARTSLARIATATGLSLRETSGGTALVAARPGDALLLLEGPPTLVPEIAFRAPDGSRSELVLHHGTR